MSIIHAANWATGHDATMRETGGVLVGHVHGYRVEVVAAVSGAHARTPDSVELNLRGHGRLGLTVVGDWHTHGGTDAEASRIDRSAWNNAYLRARPDGHPFWVAVIAAVEKKFREPILRAWTVDGDGLHPFTI